MAAMNARPVRRTWPIAYGHRARTSPDRGVGLAWVLFLGLGLPFVLMSVLTILARAGFYVEILRPLWQPWPPDLLKPFLGVAVFAATLAYLAYRVGRRAGFRSGTGVRLVSARASGARTYPGGRPASAASTSPVSPSPLDEFEEL